MHDEWPLSHFFRLTSYEKYICHLPRPQWRLNDLYVKVRLVIACTSTTQVVHLPFQEDILWSSVGYLELLGNGS